MTSFENVVDVLGEFRPVKVRIVEGLDLRRVSPGPYFLVCAPLKVAGAEGAPARVFLLDRAPSG